MQAFVDRVSRTGRTSGRKANIPGSGRKCVCVGSRACVCVCVFVSRGVCVCDFGGTVDCNYMQNGNRNSVVRPGDVQYVDGTI